jgi:hypothetical protein
MGKNISAALRKKAYQEDTNRDDHVYSPLFLYRLLFFFFLRRQKNRLWMTALHRRYTIRSTAIDGRVSQGLRQWTFLQDIQYTRERSALQEHVESCEEIFL